MLYHCYRNRCTIVTENDASLLLILMYSILPKMMYFSLPITNCNYRHEMSKWMISGFRIKVKSGKSLTRDELIAIGRIILCNNQLVRRIVVLGWDTLEVYDAANKKGVQWAFKDFISLRLN